MEKYTPLHTLHSPITDETICVRVSRLWYHCGGDDSGPIKDIHMVVVDIKGDALHVIVPHGFFSQHIHILHETNVYEISKFLLVKKQEVMRPVDMPFAIMITRATVIQLKENLAHLLPEWSYSLTPFSSLPAPTVEPGCLIDVIGTISGISDIESFNLPNSRTVLNKRHVHLKDLSGHEIKIVLWGNCASRFNGNTIRALGQKELAVAIFVGTTAQEYDGKRGLAGMAACSWYINEDIVDINIFQGRFEGPIQPIIHAPMPHILHRRTQFGVGWPKKHIAQLAAFNLFENKDFKFRCTVTLSRISSSKKWWYSSCQQCHRLATPNDVDAPTYTCSRSACKSTTANIGYFLSVIGLDQTGEAEFTLFGALAEQLIGNSIHQVIRNNQPTGPLIVNDVVAASRVRFPPPEVSKVLGNRYRFVVAVTAESFAKRQISFMVRKIEAVFPRARRLSSADTIIPATSWDIDTPMVEPNPLSQNSSSTEPGPSNQVGSIPAGPVVVAPNNNHIINTPGNQFGIAVPYATNYLQGALQRNTYTNFKWESSAGGTIQTLLGSNFRPRLSSAVTANNRKRRRLELDGRKELNGSAPL